MKITIITTTMNSFNAGRREQLAQNINSVLNQDYEGIIEQLFIDGASTDGTKEYLKQICEQQTPTRTRRLISERDSGIYDAMNKGINNATGEYILFLNSDDYFSNETAVRLSVEALKKTSADFSYGQYRILDGNKLSGIRKYEIGLFFLRMPFCHQTMLTKTEILRRAGGFDLSYKSASDFDLALRLFLSGCTCVCVPHELVHFRTGGFSENRELSEGDVKRSIKENLSKIYTLSQDDANRIFDVFEFPRELFLRLQQIVSMNVLLGMNEIYPNFRELDNNFLKYEDQANSWYFSDPPASPKTTHTEDFIFHSLHTTERLFSRINKTTIADKVVSILKNIVCRLLSPNSSLRTKLRPYYHKLINKLSIKP